MELSLKDEHPRRGRVLCCDRDAVLRGDDRFVPSAQTAAVGVSVTVDIVIQGLETDFDPDDDRVGLRPGHARTTRPS